MAVNSSGKDTKTTWQPANSTALSFFHSRLQNQIQFEFFTDDRQRNAMQLKNSILK